MLSSSEKAYCQALLALRDKKYLEAHQLFGQAAANFGDDPEFRVLRETTELLLAVKREIAGLSGKENESLQIEEAFSHG